MGIIGRRYRARGISLLASRHGASLAQGIEIILHHRIAFVICAGLGSSLVVLHKSEIRAYHHAHYS
jgi:hypothetical protein